ncbi:hypothetical protein BC936DRAFT_145573 [Jimgerdemannia flammicorona]|uniref:UBR-type domain-containing protein n=1 Tax=Jimgerdemannia flammicorona TaxID=994334 RepID=A0A433D9Q2_9FUNG|nr:hypothetical protein BC936DRAFT_145573 [Jimgerdemannia flammicorona]
MFASNEEDTVTAVEILEQQLELEREAHEILPGKFEACSFSIGYVRQPVYACRTCASPDKDPSGMCYSCSIACHGDHDLLELFVKRDFRCDCGVQGKFNGAACKLESRLKEGEANGENNYDHNFYGRFCWCDQNYDPDTEETTMFQCVICQDWFHDNCIGQIPPQDDFDEFICRTCTAKHPFVIIPRNPHFILGLSKSSENITRIIHQDSKEKEKKRDASELEDLEKEDAKKGKLDEGAADVDVVGEAADVDVVVEAADVGVVVKVADVDVVAKTADVDLVVEGADVDEAADVDVVVGAAECRAEYAIGGGVGLFLKEGWRTGLCRCSKCAKSFADNHVEFLLQEEKTYEPEEDEDAGMSLHDGGLKQLQRMDRVQALEGLTAYNKMAEQVKSFLQTFKDSGRTVTKEDVTKFFEDKLNERNSRK